MNRTVGSFLLARDKFMAEMFLRKPVALDSSGFTFSIYKKQKKNPMIQRNRRFAIYLST